jgi:hypothetical protein
LSLTYPIGSQIKFLISCLAVLLNSRIGAQPNAERNLFFPTC